VNQQKLKLIERLTDAELKVVFPPLYPAEPKDVIDARRHIDRWVNQAAQYRSEMRRVQENIKDRAMLAVLSDAKPDVDVATILAKVLKGVKFPDPPT
jgi:hypothetical protein